MVAGAASRAGEVAATERHRPAHRAARRADRRADGTGRCRVEEAALAVLPQVKGAFSLVFMDEQTLYAARDPQGIRPLVLGRLERGWVVASETAALDIVRRGFVREIEPGELVAIDENGAAVLPVRRCRSRKGCVFEYVYLARPDTDDRRPERPGLPGRGRPQARRRAPGRGRPGHPGAGVGHARRHRLRRGQRHPVRRGPGQELLRRPDLHPAVPDHQAARHPAQAQPAEGSHRGQAAGGRRRLDRPRQHPARARADAARGGRRRGARADLLPAGEVAVLLRHRLRHPGRADRQRPDASRRSAPRSAPTRWRTSPWTAWSRRPRSPGRACAGPASTASTRWSCPTPSCSASSCWSASWSAPRRDRRGAGRGRTP